MAQAVIPTQGLQYTTVGYVTANLTDPILILKVNGVGYSNGYRITYSGDTYRNFFPTYESSTGEIRLYCQAVNYSTPTPAASLGTVEVYLVY
jgi:hypothetical protein